MPKVTITDSEANHLNELYSKFVLSITTKSNPKKPILKSDKKDHKDKVFFGYRTSKESKYTDAPIQFTTTGVLPLITYNDGLNPRLNLVIVDEAHRILEETEDIEIAISLFKKQGVVVVNYMSATLETDELEQRLETNIIKVDRARFKNFYHNTGKPMLDCIENTITKTLIESDILSEYYPNKAHQSE